MELMPGYKRSDVGVIPEDWDVGAIGDAFEIRNQLRQPISQSVRERMVGPYPYYGPTSVQGWINEYRIEGEHALIGEDGDHFLKWRDQAMTLLVTGRFNVNNHAHIVRGTNNLTSWFYWFFANRDITSYLTRQGAGRYKLTKATLEKLPCAIPPLDEQRAIAQALSDVDALLATLGQVIAKKRDLKQATMQQLLTGEKRLPGFSGDWELKSFGDLFDFSGGYSASRDQLSNEGHCYLHYGDIHGSTKTCVNTRRDFLDIPKLSISLERISEGSLLKHGDVVFVDASEDDAGTSKHLVIENEDDVPFISGLHTIVAKSKTNDLAHAYKHYCFKTPAIRQQFMFYAVGTKVSGISKTNIAKLTLPIPSTPEQVAIAAVLSSMDVELATLEARRDKTRNIKQAMMQELLTGRTRLV